MGKPIRSLNSIVVGLCAVGAGVAVKPADLAVSWEPHDLKLAEREARDLAIRSLMVMACDSLDGYIKAIGSEPILLGDSTIASILSGATEYGQPSGKPTQKDIATLSELLVKSADDPSKIRKALRDFSSDFGGSSKKPSSRDRVWALDNHVRRLAVAFSREAPVPPLPYWASIDLMIDWRNNLVHGAAQRKETPKAIAELEASAQFLRDTHANIDINQMIERYRGGSEVPSLKEVSTFVSILLRYVAAADAVLIANLNVEDYARECLRRSLQNAPWQTILRKWQSFSVQQRLRKALPYLSSGGFVSAADVPKKGHFEGLKVSHLSLPFLNQSSAEELRVAIGIE